MTNPDDPIHPKEPKHLMGDLGLTKREWFAGLAMHDVITGSRGYPFSANEMMRRAVECADALIAELNKKP